jgi:hypothetical protein
MANGECQFGTAPPSNWPTTRERPSWHLQDDQSVLVLKPSRLCVQTDPNGQGFENPGVHLMCYARKPVAPTPLPSNVMATDFVVSAS